jgi:hypothetical protein
MNLINIRAIGGAPYGAGLASEVEDDAEDARSFRQSGRAFRRRYLHLLYRETLKDYREAPTDWMRRASRNVLNNIWTSYRDTRNEQ